MFHIKKASLFSLFILAFFILTAANDVHAQTSNPQIIAQAKTNIRELPKTGLPLAVLGLAGILPAGLILGKLLWKKKGEESANSIWNDRHFK